MDKNGEQILELRNITKRFSEGVAALQDVTLTAKRGEVLALVGENGAGKSTLVKILAGAYPYGSFAGELMFHGEKQRFLSVADAESAGIVMIPQELHFLGELSVGENIFLNHEPANRFGVIDWDRLYTEAQTLVEEFAVGCKVTTPVYRLSVVQRRLIQIAKAVSSVADLLILDEPTTALPETETQLLFDHIERLRKRGITCIYISHRIQEVLQVADRVAILRDGCLVGVHDTHDLTTEKVVFEMVGRDISNMYPKEEAPIGETVLEVRDLAVHDATVPTIARVKNASFEIRKGEIVGLFGLMGSGQSEVAHALFGAYGGRVTGEVRIAGRNVAIRSPLDAIRAGLALLTADRKGAGLVLSMNVRENLSLASLPRFSEYSVIDEKREAVMAREYVTRLSIKVPSTEADMDNLSGGNQQKVVVGKWLATEPSVLLLEEPTLGIDVGAKVEIYSLLNQLAQRGHAVLFISSELPELCGMADRVLVMRKGTIVGEFSREEATEGRVLHCASVG